MELADKTVVVTGAARGIGRALVERFLTEGARVVLSDCDAELTRAEAQSLGCLGIAADVSDEADVARLVEAAQQALGRIDLFCSNAGTTVKGGIEVADSEWQRLWQINLMSQVYAARAVIPLMLAQGSGYLLQTSSAAGLLTEIGSAAYSVTKHAVISFAEWLAIRYGRQGIKVSCLCPAGVSTAMLESGDVVHDFLAEWSVTPATAAECVVEGLRRESFLIHTHAQVEDFYGFKFQNYEAWLHNFGRLSQKLERRQAHQARKQGRDRPAD